MGASTSTLSVHIKESNDLKDEVSSSSAMKSPKSSRKNLHVSFTKRDMDKPTMNSRASNHYTQIPIVRLSTDDTRSKSLPASGYKINYDRQSVQNGSNGIKVSSNGVSSYVPTHLPPSFNRSNNNRTSDSVGFRHSRYDNGDVPDHYSAPTRSTSNLSRTSSASRRSRGRSVSPGRREKIIVQGTLTRSDLEYLKGAIRSAKRSSSVSGRKLTHPSTTSDSSIRNGDKMTSFVIGRPAKFTPAAFGDMGVFKAISAVNENLYICGVMALSEEKVKALKINCVVNATLEWPPFQIPGLETVRVQIDDVPSANLAPYFDKIADKINEVISRGGRVLVHCMAGISRSSTLCITYLMKHKGYPLQAAYSLMRSKRPLVRPNDGFWRQLIQYEKELKRRKMQKSSSLPSDDPKSSREVTAHHQRSLNENPSMTVTRLTSAQASHPVGGSTRAARSSSQTFLSSATNPRQMTDGRRGYANHSYQSASSLLPSATPSSPKKTSVHRLGTLRSLASSAGGVNPQPQRDIAVSAMRAGDHWSTTYGSDYSKQIGRRY